MPPAFSEGESLILVSGGMVSLPYENIFPKGKRKESVF